MPIFHQSKCIFIHIPKTGGSSIFLKLKAVSGSFELFGKAVPSDYDKYQLKGVKTIENKEKNVRLLHHLPAIYVKKIVGEKTWDNYFKFAVVRNPWDRMVSWYCYINKHRDVTGNQTFREWILQNNWFPPQYPYVVDENGKVMVDLLIPFEEIQNNFDFVCSQLNISPQLLPHEKKSNRLYYRHYYDDEIRELVAENCSHDIKLFGYNF